MVVAAFVVAVMITVVDLMIGFIDKQLLAIIGIFRADYIFSDLAIFLQSLGVSPLSNLFSIR